jgi:hypothetical protein
VANSQAKKEAVTLAIKTFIDIKRGERLSALIGNYEFGYSLTDLGRIRNDG